MFLSIYVVDLSVVPNYIFLIHVHRILDIL